MDYLVEIKQYHHCLAEQFKGSPKGCHEREVAALEKQIGFSLPLAYKQYLLWMGKDYQGVFVGSNWFITDVKGNAELLPELLQENGITFSLPEHFLCFFSHQGYIAAWFELPARDDDPPIWFYGEGQGMDKPVLKGRFTDFLFQDLQGLVACLSSSAGNR